MLKVQKFIRANSDWEVLLSVAPFNLSISHDSMFGRNLVMFKYDQLNSDFHNDIVKECRGLILDADTFEVVSYPFNKFFNYGEKYADDVDWHTSYVTEKIDGCVSFDTKVKTTIGDVDMAEICANPSKYEVLTFNHDTNEIEANKVDAVSIKDSADNWYEIELENGKKLTVTGNHRIWCENLHCYRRVDELDGTEDLVVI